MVDMSLFTLSESSKREMCAHLTPRQAERILRIFSIADVLGMMISVGVIDAAKMPIDPNK